MEEKLLKIINHYGLTHQLEYFQGEVWELNEAITSCNLLDMYLKDMSVYDYQKFGYVLDNNRNAFIKHIAEEIADCLVMLEQFRLYFDYDAVKVGNNIIYPESDILKYSKLFQKQVFNMSEYILILSSNYKIKSRMLEIYYTLKQIQLYYGITDENIKKVMEFKIDRQLGRIENEEVL